MFSHSKEEAIREIDKITEKNIIKKYNSEFKYEIETDNEIWRWVKPDENLRGLIVVRQ